MALEDLKFAVDITDKLSWDFTEEDFKFMMELEPEGCFVLFFDSEKVGIATALSFGEIGWFGNLVVDENYRDRGAGSLLVKHSVKYLKNKNVETIGLYAYIDKIRFYRRLGFRYDSEFITLRGKGPPSSTRPNLKKAQKAQKDIMKDIVDYDCSHFGASRKKLLEAILLNSANTCYVCIEGGQIRGYAAAKVYEDVAELGPSICEKGREDIATDLLWANLSGLEGLEVSVCVPRKELVIIDMLSRHGFTEKFRVARMFFGSPIAKDCVYVAESLERG